MSERPIDIDELDFDTNLTNTAEPITGLKDDGYPTNAIPASDNFNWLKAKVAIYLRGGIRDFDNLDEAVAAVAAPELLRVAMSPGAANRQRGSIRFQRQGTGGAFAILDMSCDGEFLYYLQDIGTRSVLYAAKGSDGAHEWSRNLFLGSDANCVASDGKYVYVGTDVDGGNDELIVTTRAGAAPSGSPSSIDVAATVVDIDADGLTVAFVFTNQVDWYSVAADGALTFDDTYSHGAALNAVKLTSILSQAGGRCAIIGGTRNTYDVRAILLGTAAAIWEITLPTVGAPTVADIERDGDLIYVATDRQALSAGGNANLYALAPFDGSVVWAKDIGTTEDADRLAVDDRFLYVALSGGDLLALDKWTGVPVFEISTASVNGQLPCCDGVQIFSHDGGDDILGHYRGGVPRIMQRVSGADSTRRPFFNLAVPLEDSR